MPRCVLSCDNLCFLILRILNGYTNILIYGSEVLPGCKVIAQGSADADAIITVDFGQGTCSTGASASLHAGIISINGNEIVSFSTAYKDIVFVTSDCADEISIFETYSDASSVEVISNAGDDNIIIGGDNRPLDTNIFCNIIVDGGPGSDVLTIRDYDSLVSKSVEVHSTMLRGLYGSEDEAIFYFYVEEIDMTLCDADAQVDVYSTAKHAKLTLTTGGKASIFGSIPLLLQSFTKLFHSRWR